MANHRRGLFLDLDGTLADSLSAMRQAYHLFLAKRGAHGSSAEFDSLNGPPLHEVVASLQQTHGLTGTLDDLTAAYLNTVARFHQATRPTEGAEQVLTKALSLGWRVAVVTSNKRAIACDWLARTGLDRAVSLVVAAEDSSQGKPTPSRTSPLWPGWSARLGPPWRWKIAPLASRPHWMLSCPRWAWPEAW